MVMSSLEEPGAKGESTYIQTNDITRKHQKRHILKAKENALKYKCSRALRRKLKKYKLRHDGKEDQDVLDVSKTLITLLKIKSPNNRNQEDNCQSTNYSSDENLPRNYLFKMGRRKQNIKTNDSVDSNTTFANSSYDKDGNVSPVCDYKEKQHTNAFKLMMDSRNKSIGSNSPGKEKNETQMIQNETEAQDIFEKKIIKAKRNLVLQKMAEAKGSLKKKVLEEYQEKCIKKKMEERAKRLKSMIKNNETKLSKKEIDTDHVQSCLTSTSDVVELSHKKNNSKKQQKSLTLINLFSESTKLKNNKSPEKNYISKEDNEFLKKLSPSLKKKENMLCYFKKIEKEPTPLIDIENETVEVNDDIVIKVKLSSRSKKKGKKKKLSLNKTDDNDNPKHCTELESTDAVTMADTDLLKIKSDRRKRKRNDNTTESTASNKNGDIVMDSPVMEYMRPKRNVKKPVKYVDNLALSSSDEELHIFTPKKKKHSENKQNSKHTTTNAKKDKSLFQNKQHSKDTILTNNGKENKCLLNTVKNSKESSSIPGPAKLSKDCNIKKKNTKLAPIFAVKPQVDPAVIEAKQKFLHSGVPDKLKKVITEQKNISMQLSIFPVVVHVQQKVTPEVSTVILNKLHFGENELCDNLYVNNEVNLFKKLLDMHKDKNNKQLFDRKHKVDSHVVLKNIKHIYPKFPVFRTYRSLKDRNSGNFKDYSYTDLDNSIDVINGMIDINNQNPDKLNWTDKYKPMSTKQIIGNFEAIKELKKWLVTWTENEANSKKKGDLDSDLSDFYHSDTDSKDSIKPCNNLLIIKGPVGSGKTSSVYAVAAELAIKVIEVNVSGKRTGKIMLQDLQEATQSHKVNRGKSNTENSQKSQDVTEDSMNKVKKKGRPKKKRVDVSSKNTMSIKDECLSQSQPSSSQESTRTGMSLILIDDADIVFEQDDGFISAIVQLVQCSKRPVVLITSLKSCPHLQRFLLNAKKIIMQPLLPRILGTWLDIMCLADSNICLPGIGAKFLDYFHGDIRKTMNSLQFYISSQISQSVDDKGSSDNYECFVDIDDENSSMSWADHEVPEIKCTSIPNMEDKDNMKQFFHHLSKILQFGHPLDLYKIWWTIPRFLNFSPKCGTSESLKNDGNSEKSLMGISEMEMIAKVIDAVSVSDYYSHIKPDTLMNITSQPWYSVEYDSVSEQENLCYYNRNYNSIDEVSHKLVFGCIIEAQKEMGLESNVDVHFPSMIEQRERDKIVNNHNNLTSYLNPSAVLDRRALALDFWPSCRSICRIEKTKTDSNSKKRNNRFCHYLKSLNVMCKMNSFDMLADSLHPKSND